MIITKNTDRKEEALIEKEFLNHLGDVTLKYLLYMTGMGTLLIVYFMYTDVVIRHNLLAMYTRILPLILCVFMFIFQLFTQQKYKRFKTIYTNIILLSVILMMYEKCIVHIYERAIYSSVAGTIVVIFIVSLFIKTNAINTIIMYFVPTIIFVIIIYLMPDVPRESILAASNIYPIIILGLIANRIQNNLRYKAFKSNYLLNVEKK